MNFTNEKKEELRQRYLKVDTANVADVLDTLGYMNQGLAHEFAPYPSDTGKLAGWAYTIRGQMTPYELGGDSEKMKACQGLSSGEVSVWSGDGEGICYFGELIAIGMKEKGCVGSLIDGGIRDIRWIKEQNFPIYARYRTPVQSIGRWKVNGCQIPVVLRGATSSFVTVNPGDFVLGDEDGVIIIPQEVVEKVLIEVEALTETEQKIRVELSKGLSLQDALKQFGHV